MNREILTLPDPERTAARLAADAANVLRTAPVSEIHMGVSGGSVATSAFPALVRELSDIDPAQLPAVHLWLIDERFVPASDPERNINPIERALRGSAVSSAFRLHPALASGMDVGLDEAAAQYGQHIAASVPPATDSSGLPAFDLLLLGAGPDGHTASLFPDREEVNEREAITLPVRNSPKPPPERITMSLPLINAAARAWLLATGEGKAEAIALGHADVAPAASPIGAIAAREETRWYLDDAAAGLLGGFRGA